MEEKFSPVVASFLVRVVRDQPKSEKAGSFRGQIGQIQMEEELNFTCWKEVESFIQSRFPIEEENQIKGDDHEIEG